MSSYSADSIARRLQIMIWGLAIAVPIAGAFGARNFFIDYGLETRGVATEGKIIQSTIGQQRGRASSFRARGSNDTQINHVVEYVDAAGSHHTTISIEKAAYHADENDIRHLPIGTPIQVVYDSRHPEVAKPIGQFNSFPDMILMGLGIFVIAIEIVVACLWLRGRLLK